MVLYGKSRMNEMRSARRIVPVDEFVNRVNKIRTNSQDEEKHSEPIQEIESESEMPKLTKRTPSGLSLALLGSSPEKSPVSSSQQPPSPLAYPEAKVGMSLSPFTLH
eukprot:CAMPEP_0114359498 /NCGR_PEP_ID=MMETSP0101-20121206/23062_1 /TAXON_ID=38822 ORGANISM="Pteridomonas danica, Strain PT" /NCGR_SAMPLE_ID=MMETSP0101 /ASSEMBLY_ACC=CAM_ASM_000211 /LENGTH=106 /DNA_ID=CAMNT_0001503071 /DNA_START=178 /DNA_END=498 /DNA_ORIENTATION=+